MAETICPTCGKPIDMSLTSLWQPATGKLFHIGCQPPPKVPPPLKINYVPAHKG